MEARGPEATSHATLGHGKQSLPRRRLIFPGTITWRSTSGGEANCSSRVTPFRTSVTVAVVLHWPQADLLSRTDQGSPGEVISLLQQEHLDLARDIMETRRDHLAVVENQQIHWERYSGNQQRCDARSDHSSDAAPASATPPSWPSAYPRSALAAGCTGSRRGGTIFVKK